jgi:D-alanine-D-alanine ligase
MNIDVDPDWWKTLFDEVYLLTDARSVCDEMLTRREVDVICELLPVKMGHRILDLCGGHGRHTFELCKRGFTECTLVDYSQTLIDIARSEANQNDYAVQFLQCDARNTKFLPETFDHVIVMGNSLGYIQEPEADNMIMAEAMRVLRPAGWLLVDVADGNIVKKSFSPNSWHEIGEQTVVCRQRELMGNMINSREMVIDKHKGLIRDQTYAVRLYDSEALGQLIQQAGFSNVTVHTNFSPHRAEGDFGFMNNRMIGVGQKI